MSVKVTTGNIFESDAQTLINTVNCVGVMGKGVALEFKKRYPAMFEEYEQRCKRGLVKLGVPYIYKGLTPPWIINFPTKQHWRMPSELGAIIAGLDYLEQHYNGWGVTSIASPPLGCGLGNLDWYVVGPELYKGFSKLQIPVVLYAPYGTPPDQMTSKFLGGKQATESESPAAVEHRVSPAIVAIIEAMRRIAATQFYHPSSIEFHKMAYFATALGLPTGLTFQRRTYGPFCDDLKREESKLQLNGLLVLSHKGDKIEHAPGPAYQSNKWKDQLKEWDTEIDKLVDLFLRVSSTRYAELYATVHFTANEIQAQQQHRPSEREVLAAVAEWKKRKELPFSESEISDAIRLLNMLGWLDLELSSDLPLPEESLVA